MDRRILTRGGQSLLELTAAMVIFTLVFSALVPFCLQRIQTAKFQATVAEMKAIADAAVDYYVSQGTCPSGVTQLSPDFLSQPVISSPFLSNYQLNCSGNGVSISDLIPAGLAQRNPEGPLFEVKPSGSGDNIVITEVIPHIATGRLLYDKKYLYGGS